MNRRAVKLLVVILLLMLGGAIVNVAVAWGCSRLHPIAAYADCRLVSDYEHEVLVQESLVPGQFLDKWGSDLVAWDATAFGRCTSAYSPQKAPRLMNFYTADFAYRTVVGWPQKCFDGWTTFPGGGWPPQSQFREVRALRVSNSFPPFYPDIIPFAPLWPGCAINTIYYAAILWVIFFTPGKLRRSLRRRRGLCPACAYPVGTSPICTECGKPV